MKSPERWRPTKYVTVNGTARGSRDEREVNPASRLIADRVAAFYDRAIPRYAHGRLLDLGCGKAPLYGLYRAYVDGVTCVDWAESRHENPHLDLFHDLNRPLPLRSAAFDTVILSDVLEHIREPVALMREISRCLVPGGVLLLNVPFFYWLHELPHDFFRYTRYSLEYLSSEVGLQPISLVATGGLPEILADVASKSCVQVPYIGKGIAAATQYAVGNLTRTGPGRRLSTKTAEHFPLGYAMVARRG